jgi:hypothetical protein
MNVTGGKMANLQQHGPRVILKVIRMITSMTPIPMAVLSLGIDPTIPMRSMKKPIRPIPVRYKGRRPTRPMTVCKPRDSFWPLTIHCCTRREDINRLNTHVEVLIDQHKQSRKICQIGRRRNLRKPEFEPFPHSVGL